MRKLWGGHETRERIPGEVWVLVSACFLVAIGFGMMAPVVPAFATTFGVGVTAASFVVSAFAIVRLAFAPASGSLVSRFAERPVLLWGLVINAVSTAACAWATSYWQLIGFRSIAGLGSVMFTVAAIGLVIRLSPVGLRGRVSGLWSTSFLLGNMAGPLFGGLFAGASLRLPFVIYGTGTVLAALLIWLLLKKSGGSVTSASLELPEFTVRQAVRRRAYRASLASSFAVGWISFGVRFSLIPLFVVGALHESSTVSGIGLSIYAVGTAAVLMIAGRIADLRGRKPVVLAGLAILTVGSVLLGLATTTPLFFAAALISGIGSGLVTPAQTATVADVIGTDVRGGPVLAFFQMAADFGAIIGPLAAGVIVDLWSYQAAFVLCGLISALALGLWLIAPETLVGGRERPPTRVSPERQATPGSEVCGPAADTSSS
ncbi:MFS transporter [Kibdelosporangium persicum]|uniref:Arabinose ABC transporter permease n=1 Tax=Kibdelosporangium persicum TaxID=2698649 RepID=A0ABX2FKL4_9PSEU|nr:MFS transporter [Kibdelosporangium persicum]NRN71280.1 Arabinose ABC transporter permease [Kibdelosporangium persicum]